MEHEWTIVAASTPRSTGNLWRWCIRCGALRLETARGTFFFYPGPRQVVGFDQTVPPPETGVVACQLWKKL